MVHQMLLFFIKQIYPFRILFNQDRCPMQSGLQSYPYGTAVLPYQD